MNLRTFVTRRLLGTLSLSALMASAAALQACDDTPYSLEGGDDLGNAHAPDPVGTGTGLAPGGLPDPATCTEAVPSVQVRRITRDEYERGVQAAFGLGLTVTSAFPPDQIVRGFDNNAAALTISSTLARGYLDAAEVVSAKVADVLPSLTKCAVDQIGSEACVRGFIASKAQIAWRRTLTKGEQDGVYTLYSSWAAMAGSDVRTAYRVVVERILNSPSFLYRAELGMPGNPGAVVTLAPPELAARLSFLIWGQPPDAALLDAAQSGGLDAEGALLSKVDAMLADPRATAGLRDFHKRVFSVGTLDTIEKNSTLFPNFSSAQASSMKEEIYRLTEAAWAKGDVSTLFSSTASFVDANLAGYYGISSPGPGFQQVALDPAQRRGILTTPGMMAILAKSNESAPVRRGAFIREMMFCQHLEAPTGLAATPPKADPNLTTRERFDAHRKDPACAGCHALMDPIGLSYEHYDAIGKWRDTENTRPIDDSGELTQTDVDGTFHGGAELGNKIAQSKFARTCYSMQMFRWAMGRLEGAGDACTLAKVSDAFVRSGNNPKELLRALIKSPSFRSVRLPEVLP